MKDGVQCMFWGVVTKFLHANCLISQGAGACKQRILLYG